MVNENFIDGIITMNLTRDPTVKEGHEDEKLDIDDEAFVKFALTKSNISDYGLNFFFEVLKDLVISKETIEIFYNVIVKLARTKKLPIDDIPEMPGPDAEGNEPSEEAKAEVQKLVEDITSRNAESEKINEDIDKIQSKIKINFRPPIDPEHGAAECALMRINNYRELKGEESDTNIENVVNYESIH